jgi:hypothetical protein
MLREKVPSFSKNKTVHDLCEDVIETFGSLYPDQALNLCFRIALELSPSSSNSHDEGGGTPVQRKGAPRKKPRLQRRQHR